MKNFLIDLCLVFLVLYVGQSLFDASALNKKYFNESLASFEEDIQNENILKENYLLPKDKDNAVALFIGSVSQGCISLIRYVVLWLAEIVSYLLE